MMLASLRVPNTWMVELHAIVPCVPSQTTSKSHCQYLWELKDWIDRKWVYNYTGGLPTMDDDEGNNKASLAARHINNPVAASAGPEALAILDAAPMRCGGCGAKVMREGEPVAHCMVLLVTRCPGRLAGWRDDLVQRHEANRPDGPKAL